MYTDFYGLRADPFRMYPDHNFCFRHASFSRAKAYMRYALHREEGFVLITGEPGTGKTTLIGDLISDYNQTDFDIAKLVGAKLEGDDLLRMVSHAFRVPVIGTFKSEILNHLHRYFTDIHKRKRRPLLIVDEAQVLAGEALEELRLLTNLPIDGRPLLQIVLVGQSELRDLILDPAMKQLHQRIVGACHLEPLKPLDTAAYIVHRLKCTGWVGRPMINIEIFPDLYNFSRGIPRRINQVFSRLLLHCTLEEKNWLDASDVRLIVEELRKEDLFPGNPSAEIELNDFDVNELLSLVQPDKPKVTPKLAVSETSRQVSPTVADSLEEQLAAIPDTQLITSPTPESEYDKLETEESASSDNADQKNMSSPVAHKGDRKMAGAETLADRSVGEFRYLKPDLMAYENTKRQKKAVEDTSFSCADTSRHPRNWWIRRRAVAVSLTGGLVLTVGTLLSAPSYQLNRMATDSTWSQLGVKQARNLLTRLSGGNLPIGYDSELQQPVISDLEKPVTAGEKPNIEHHPESRELAEAMYESGSAQSESVDRNQATPLPVKTEKPNNTVLPKEPEPTARKAIPGEDNQEPGGQLIATKDKRTSYTSDESDGLRQQDGNFPVGPSIATVGEVSFELGSAEKDLKQQPMLNGIAASQTTSDEHTERVGDPLYTERPSEHRAIGVDRYLVDREYEPNHVLAKASIPETQSNNHSLQPLVEAQQPVETNSNEVLEAAKTNLNLHDRNVTTDIMTELAPEFDIEPVVAQAAGLDEKAKTAKIEKLLLLGEQAVTRYRLRYPKDQSAWYYYSKVIELDPGNQAAERGLQKIAERYAQLVSNLMVKQQYAKARTYVNRGLGILPENTELRRVEQELDNHYAELLRLQKQDAQALAVAASRSRTKPVENEPSDIFSKLKSNFLSGKTQTPEQFFQANDH